MKSLPDLRANYLYAQDTAYLLEVKYELENLFCDPNLCITHQFDIFASKLPSIWKSPNLSPFQWMVSNQEFIGTYTTMNEVIYLYQFLHKEIQYILFDRYYHNYNLPAVERKLIEDSINNSFFNTL